MGKSKKKLDDLKKDLKTLKKKDMKKIVGGKNDKKKKNWNNGLGGIVPQWNNWFTLQKEGLFQLLG